jgi:two-component system, sensor histidine kinase and response regulator
MTYKPSPFDPIWDDHVFTFLESSQCTMVAIIDLEGSILYANRGFTDQMGVDTSRFINPSMAELLTKAEKATEAIFFNGYLTYNSCDNTHHSMLTKAICKNSQILLMGEYEATIVQRQNIVLQELNLQVNQLQKQLLQKNKMQAATIHELNCVNQTLEKNNADKNLLLQILSHDLKAHFISILGFTRSLLKNHTLIQEAERERKLGIIKTAAQSAFDLLGDLLQWIRAQTSGIDITPTNLDIHTTLAEIIMSYDPQLRHKSLSVSLDVPMGTMLISDLDILQTILRNLLSNAIKFSHEGGSITFSLVVEDSFIILNTSDNGVGMGADLTKSLFLHTKKRSRQGTAGEKGTGLGLMVVKDFALRLGGDVSVESEPHVGSTFALKLPLFYK